MCIGSDPKHDISDWIQDMYQIGSKTCIKLDPKSVSAHWHQSVSGSEPCAAASAFVTSPLCDVAATHANVEACHEM